MANMTSTYIPAIGDVVVIKNTKKQVVVGCENYEDVGSCSYYRNYELCNLEDVLNYIKQNTELPIDFIKKKATKIEVRGTEFSFPFQKCEDEIPFEIKPVTVYKIRRKIPKTITVYE